MSRSRFTLVLVLSLATACGGSARQDSATATGTTPPPDAAAVPDAGAAGPAPAEFLPTPYTAEQIRDEWVTGFILTLRRGVPLETSRQRWTVVAADADGVTIEFAELDEDGAAVGEPRANRSTWTELRDHARFPAAHARREETRRTTALGELEGWLYTVEDPERGATTLFFFAHDYPGAPVWMRTTRGDDVLDQLEQLQRQRPE